MILVLAIITRRVPEVRMGGAVAAACVTTNKISCQVNVRELSVVVEQHGRPLHSHKHMGGAIVVLYGVAVWLDALRQEVPRLAIIRRIYLEQVGADNRRRS